MFDDNDSFIDYSTQISNQDFIDEKIEEPAPKRTRLARKLSEEKLPGDETFPVNFFSLTIFKTQRYLVP